MENGFSSYLTMIFWRSCVVSGLSSIFALVLQRCIKVSVLSPLEVTENETSWIPFILEVGDKQVVLAVCYTGKFLA